MDRTGYSGNRFAVWQRRRQRKKDGNFTCLSPWSIISCWFSLRRTKGANNLEKHSEEEEEGRYGEIMDCMHGGSSSSLEESGPSAGHGKEVSFDLGVGFGIIYLLAASKYELNKMVALSKQMETLVQEFKMQLQNQRKGTVFRQSESNITPLTDAQDQTHNVPVQEDPYSLETKNSDATSSCGQNNYCNIDVTAKDTKMDQLEAELEVELEHLQVQLDSEVMINCECTERVVEDSAPEESIAALSFEQVFEASERKINMEDNGVSPIELERRLQELLAVREEERIKALESALARMRNAKAS